jgi:tetratricopeptide (TPR) repeat protein
MALAAALAMRHAMRGRYTEAEDVVRRSLAVEKGPLDSAFLHDRLGSVLRVQGRPEDALRAYRTAERVLEGMEDRGPEWWERWIDLELDQAAFFYFENHQDELASLVERLEAHVAERGSPVQHLEFLHVKGQQAYRLERYALSEETEALVRETYRRGLELDDWSSEFTIGFCLLWRGKPEEAEAHFVRGVEVTRSRGVALLETRCLVYGVIARRRQNDVEGARAWVRELEAQDELHGYRGLTAANAAWIAYRDGDVERALARGEEALAEWGSHGRTGSGVFSWTARFPLLGAELARGRVREALDHARAMFEPTQQPLPAPITEALERALATSSSYDLEAALELARADGYA